MADLSKLEQDCIDAHHEGQYQSAGVVTMQSARGATIMTMLFCKKCGWVGAKNLEFATLSVAGISPIHKP